MAELTIGRAGIAPGLDGYIAAQQIGQQRQQQEAGMLMRLIQLQQAQEEAGMRRQKFQQEQELAPLQRKLLEAQIGDKVAATQAATTQRGALAQLLPELNKPNEADALRQFGVVRNPDGTVSRISGMETLADEPRTVDAQNPNKVQSLMAMVDPKSYVTAATKAMFRDEKKPTIVRGTIKDANSPTGWSHADLNDNRILATGAPPPASTNEPQGSTVITSDGLFNKVGGKLVPLVHPTTGEPLRSASSDNQSLNRSISLRRTYDSNPEVVLANSLEPKVGPMADYIIKISTPDQRTGVKEKPTAVSDAELTKLFIMTTHPKGDQISNMDLREIAKLPDLPGRVKVAIGGFFEGKTLDDDIRKDMWSSISNKYNATSKMRKARKEETLARARTMGLDPELLFPSTGNK